MVSPELLDKIEDNILIPYHKMDFEQFSEELDFIRETAIQLEGTGINVGGESIDIETEVTHGTPAAQFNSESDESSIPVSCEIADLLLILESRVNNSIEHQRAMLVQAKFEPTNASSEDQYWTVNMRQLELLSQFPVFQFRSRKDYGTFDLDPSCKTFATYAFASTYKIPFYNSTDRVFSERNLANCDFSQKTSRYRPKDFIGLDSSPSILKRFLKGKLGEDITELETEERRLVKSIYDYAANDRSFKSMFTDGGRSYDDYPNFDFAVIKFTHNRERDDFQIEDPNTGQELLNSDD